MRIPLEMTFRNVPANDAIAQFIRDKAAKLEDIHDGIVSCRVAVERPHEHQQNGNPYRVRINLRVPPGKELVVRRETTEGDLHDNLHAVVADAFEAIRRQVQKAKDKLHGEVKTHARSAGGTL
jgi:ribosome-associated translation inhibitor RaiA